MAEREEVGVIELSGLPEGLFDLLPVFVAEGEAEEKLLAEAALLPLGVYDPVNVPEEEEV